MLKVAFSLFLLSFFSLFSKLEALPLDEETLVALYGHQQASLRADPTVLPPDFFRITHALPRDQWPMLPESYRWAISNMGNVQLLKHLSADLHTFDFVIYGPDRDNRVNFLSRWDSMTHHSFAHTRTPPLHNEQARNNFPINESGFKWNGQTFVRGHCIDFCDTTGLSNQRMVARSEINPLISTLDPRNYCPEPPRTHWGLSLRKELVANIRSRNGSYAQYLYYPKDPEATCNGTFIPEGCYFTEMTSTYRMQNIYHLPWDHPIHGEKARGDSWRDRLAPLLSQERFFPSPFVDDQRYPLSERRFFELPLTYQLPEIPSYQDSFLLTRAADTELSSVTGKINLILALLQTEENDEKLIRWLPRLLNHAQFLDDLNFFYFLPELSTRRLLTALTDEDLFVDPGRSFYDHLYQIYQNQEEEGLGLRKLFKTEEEFHDQIPLEEALPENLPTVIDMTLYTTKGQGLYTILKEALQSEHLPHLLNLTTPRATVIARYVRALIDEEGLPENVSLTYSPSPSKKWNIQDAFNSQNIVARRLDL